MIHILPPDEAKKIAAGEVIDRPAALVRELIDNSIDAAAANIELSIEEGGIKKIELADDGCGMDREDLALCVKTHATSKIKTLDDLSRFTTLGFRGEALAAAAAVARLEIITSTDGREAWRLESMPLQNTDPAQKNEAVELTPARRTKGTSVRTYGLFDSIPARRRFLKRESGEAALCRQILTEKAMAFPEIAFRFIQDNVLKLQLLPCGDEIGNALQKRFGELVLSDAREKVFLHTVETGGKGFKATIVFGGAELFRKDRKGQYVFANKRRIQDFGLMQALEFGLGGFFPNGTHPLGALFIEIDPSLADFNIHPAKREVRFADSGAIHYAVTSALRNYTHVDTYSNTYYHTYLNTYKHTHNDSGSSLAMKALLERRDDFIPLPSKTITETENITTLFTAEKQPHYGKAGTSDEQNMVHKNLRLAGRAFNLFILAERGKTLYLIDQHASHERLLYNHFLAGPVTVQELLVPIPFTAQSDEDEQFLKKQKDRLAALGIIMENDGGSSWHIKALPAGWKKADDETIAAILALQNAKEDLAENWAAALACHAAIKDGDYLDNESAFALAESALALAGEGGQIPRCPHGRPLWAELTREDLFRAVRRKE